MKKGLDFKHKEVININDGRKLGKVIDLEADLESGRILSIVVPGNSNRMNLFSNQELVIPWENIKQIGEETILVEV